jgi:hypothetical protein
MYRLGAIPTLDEPGLLLPLHSERRVGEHVVESHLLPIGVSVEAVLGESVVAADVIRVPALDEHVRLADGPRLVVPILAEEQGLGVLVQLANVGFRDRKHSSRTARRIVDGLHNVTPAQVFFRR